MLDLYDELDSALGHIREVVDLYPDGTSDIVMEENAKDFVNALKTIDTPHIETLIVKWEAWKRSKG